MLARKTDDRPWLDADPTKKIHLNLPLPETLAKQLDYLIENRAIHSKSSFIRDVVAAAAEEEVKKLWEVREAVRQMQAKRKKAG